MVSVWYGGTNFWSLYPWYWKLLYMFWRLLLLPLVAICYLLMPTHRFSVWMIGPPFNRLVDSFVMFVVFLCSLFYENNQDRRLMDLNFPNTGAEYIIILFTVGHICKTTRHLISRGLSRMFTTPWLIWDIIMEIFLTVTIVFWFLAWLSFNEGKRNMERRLWYYAEPMLIAEACLACATVFAFMRLFSFFQMSSMYGTLLVRLYKMMKACFQYVLLFAILMLAFVAGLNRLYEYYRGMAHEDPVSKEEMKQPESFVSLKRTFITLFWALFTMSDSHAGNVIIVPNEGVINYHYITEMTGSILFAVFEFLMVIVVLNMLIATLSDAYNTVGERIIEEWSYSKTEIYLDYMSPAYILPVPYNLLVAVLAESVQVSRNIRDPNKKWRCSLWNGCYVEDAGGQNEERYRKLLTRLTQRYYLNKCKEGQCP